VLRTGAVDARWFPEFDQRRRPRLAWRRTRARRSCHSNRSSINGSARRARITGRRRRPPGRRRGMRSSQRVASCGAFVALCSGEHHRRNRVRAVRVLACASGAVSPPPPPPPPGPPPPPPVWCKCGATNSRGRPAALIHEVGIRPGWSGWGNNERSTTPRHRQRPLERSGSVGDRGPRCARRTHLLVRTCGTRSARILTRGKDDGVLGTSRSAASSWRLGRGCGRVLDARQQHSAPSDGRLRRSWTSWRKGSQNTTTSSAVHGPGYSGNTPFAHTRTTTVTTTDYHVYTVEWNGQSIRYSVDSNQHYVVTRADVNGHGSWVFDQPFFVILNLAVAVTSRQSGRQTRSSPRRCWWTGCASIAFSR